MCDGRMPGRLLFGLGCLMVLSLTGCGQGTGDLTGKVTYKDKPVRLGTVLVSGPDGAVLSTNIQDDGTYTVPGIKLGTAKIAVNSPDPRSVKVAVRKKGDAPPPPPDASKWFAIPEKYADFQKSELTVDVSSGTRTFNLDLK